MEHWNMLDLLGAYFVAFIDTSKLKNNIYKCREAVDIRSSMQHSILWVVILSVKYSFVFYIAVLLKSLT